MAVVMINPIASVKKASAAELKYEVEEKSDGASAGVMTTDFITQLKANKDGSVELHYTITELHDGWGYGGLCFGDWSVTDDWGIFPTKEGSATLKFTAASVIKAYDTALAKDSTATINVCCYNGIKDVYLVIVPAAAAATATPTPTPAASTDVTATPTPEAAATVAPTATPAPTATVAPTAAPAASKTVVKKVTVGKKLNVAAVVVKNFSVKKSVIAKYTLSNKTVATITSKGVLTAKKAGSVTVTAYKKVTKSGKTSYTKIGSIKVKVVKAAS